MKNVLISAYAAGIFLLVVLLSGTSARNDRPIIGILSQKPSSSMVEGETKNYTSYIAASYVKFMESSGARVVPIMTYQDRSYYENMAASLNGILFPGGGVSITNSSGYGQAGQYLYEEILKINAEGTYLPLWATCLGFEMLMYLSNNYQTLLVGCDASNIALPLIPEPGYEDSLLFSSMPDYINNIFVSENVTANYHHYCVTKEDFYASGLNETMQILTTNFDSNNFEFISTVEHRTLPIFGNQWHPEKNSYIWKETSVASAIPHFPHAIESVQYFGYFFVDQARMNDQHFASDEEEEGSLIYQYTPKYVGDTGSSFEQIYLFE